MNLFLAKSNTVHFTDKITNGIVPTFNDNKKKSEILFNGKVSSSVLVNTRVNGSRKDTNKVNNAEAK